MSHSLSSVTIKDVPLIVKSGPLQVSWALKFACLALIIIGGLAFITELTSGNPQHAWTAFQVNFNFWFGLSAASACFTAVLHICNAQWVRPIRRVFEAGLPFFMISPLFLVILYFGHHHIYSWATEPAHGKEVWLSSEFVYTRDILAILLLIYVAFKAVYYSVRRDMVAIKCGLTGASDEDRSIWATLGCSCFGKACEANPREEIRNLTNRLGRLSPVVVIVYALVMSLIAFDQIMSVDPHWYSTLFGAFYFMAAVYLAMAGASILVWLLREVNPLFVQKIERRTLHDLGKLLFGFGIFWAYLFWSHYLTIWYANLPEETGYMILRLREEPWHTFAWLVLGMCFIVPFLLGLSRDLKQIPQLLCATAIIVGCGLWCFQYILLVPSLSPHIIPVGFTDLAVTLGFLGLYVFLALRFLSKVPLIPFGDFYK